MAVVVPLRLVLVAGYRAVTARQPLRDGLRLGTTLLPTLVFTIVLAGILEERFAARPALVGGLVLYTLANTLMPSILLGQRTGDLAPLDGRPEAA